MSEVQEILPPEGGSNKRQRCAEGLSVKTMLWDTLRRVKLNETGSGRTDSLGKSVILGSGLKHRKPWRVTDVSLPAVAIGVFDFSTNLAQKTKEGS